MQSREWVKVTKPAANVTCGCGAVATWTLFANGVYDYCDEHKEKSERTYMPMDDSDLDEK